MYLFDEIKMNLWNINITVVNSKKKNVKKTGVSENSNYNSILVMLPQHCPFFTLTLNGTNNLAQFSMLDFKILIT